MPISTADVNVPPEASVCMLWGGIVNNNGQFRQVVTLTVFAPFRSADRVASVVPPYNCY